MNHSHGKYPSVMAELFGRMPLDTAYFVIRRLDMQGIKVEMPSEPMKSGAHCFLFVAGGSALIDVGDKSHYFKAGECMAIPAGQSFSVRYFDNITGYMGAFNAEYMGGGGGRNIMHSFAILRNWNPRKAAFEGEEAKFVISVLERLLCEHSGGGNRNIIRASLAALLTEIEELSAPPDESDAPGSGDGICSRYMELVFDLCNYSVPLSEYAERLHISKDYLHKTIRRHTGKTPLEWITEAVLLEARTLLCHTSRSVGEIAFAVGIPDPSYFSRLFRKHTGLTPSEYRRSRKC